MFVFSTVLLITMLIALPDFRRNWILSYRWIEQESGDDILGKTFACLAATFVAPVMTILSSIKNQLGKTPSPTEPTPQVRYES